IASFFWETMVHHHSYVIGGNSSYEYCGAEDKLSDRLSDNTCETCNTYNMLKLTRHLFCWAPSASYGDYYERALYNHILASQNPENGMMTYFVPLRMGTQKEFSDSFHTFTCCVGTGMENHSKYGEGIYYKGSDGSLYVNLFIPSALQWKEKGLSVTQQTDYPASGHTSFTLALTKPTAFPIRIRKPWWAKKAPVVKINGKNYSYTTDANGFLLLSKQWKDKDQVTVDFTMDLYAEAMPDNKDRIALLYGPLVLAGQLGDSLPDPVYGIPVLLTDDKNVSDWLKPVPGKSLQFAMQKVGTPFDATLVPFYQTYKQHYTVYWDYFSPAAWENKKAAYEAEKKRQREIEASTVDYFRIGEMQPERDHNLKATERSYVDNALGVNGREARANNHISFTMKVDSAKNNSLLLVYLGDDKDRRFDILVDGKLLITVDWKGGEANKFFPMEYPLPAAMTSGKTSISVSIEANHGTTTARVFGVRTILTKTI
ncbi:MAG: glycoside hydrolase family 127 protein, partial [Bacteroidota bacterium]|nr:glycoside hydrolase family 127 protein [Bacteroidota bacterium]